MMEAFALHWLTHLFPDPPRVFLMEKTLTSKTFRWISRSLL